MRMRLYAVVACLLACAPFPAASQTDTITSVQIQKHAQANFRRVLRIPRAAERCHRPADIQKNVDWLEAAFRKRGFETRQLPNDGKPLVFAEYGRKVAGARTMLFYMHFDGQPVIPAQWAQKSPWSGRAKQPNSNLTTTTALAGDRCRTLAGEQGRSRVAHLRPLVVRRQRADHDVPRRLRCAEGGGTEPAHQRQGAARQRGGKRLAVDRQRRAAHRDLLRADAHRDPRRPDARQQPADARLRQSR